MLRKPIQYKQGSLRSGAENMRSNFMQCNYDQEDILQMPYKQDDTIYQLTKTNKNSTQRQGSVQEEYYDNQNDAESFVAYQDELGKTQESKVFSKQMRQDGNSNTQIFNYDQSISPNMSFVQSFKQVEKYKQNDQQEDKSVLSQTNNSNCNSNIMNEAINIKLSSQKDQNKSDFIYSPNLPQADSPVTLQQSNSINASCFKKCDETELERESTGFIGAWKKKPFIIITQVKQFIIQIKKYSQVLKFQQMKKNQFKLLKDNASDFQYYQMNNYIQNKKNKYSHWDLKFYVYSQKWNQFLQKRDKLRQFIQIFKQGVIEPSSLKKLIWEIFLFVSILWQIIYIPFQISFQNDQETNTHSDFFILLLQLQLPIILYLDIVFNSLQAYYSKGKLIFNRTKIFYHYVKKGNFVIDLVVANIFLFNSFLKIQYLNYFIFAKIFRLKSILRSFEERVNLRYKYSSLVDLSNLIFYVLCIAHYCGCFFFLIAVIENTQGVQQTWVDFYNLRSATVQEQYITSIYWAVITMITLGYGDYVPKTSYERVFVIFITLISCGVFAYSINQIGTIVTNITKKKSQFQQKMAQISGYLNERGIKNNMIMKIKENFAYLQRETEKDMEVHNIIQTQLCKSLRKEVFREMYIQVLKGCKAFNLNFSEPFLLNLAPFLKEKKFSPEEIIYEQDNPNQNLYFIMKGEVQLFLDMSGKKRQIKILQKNDVFGEQPFFSQAISNHSASSVNVVKVVYVNLLEFLNVIKPYQKDFETYCMMKDKLNLYSTSKRLGFKCFSCGQFQHRIQDCPFVNYIPNKDKILINYKIETNQDRNQNYEIRKKNMKHDKTISIQKQIQEEIVNFLIEKNLYENLNELLQILKNQEIVLEQKTDDKESKQKTQSSHKSLQVLYPKMNNEQGTENIIQENNSPNKPHMSTTKQGSQYVIQQQQQRKIKRTQTSQIGRSDSLAFLGASSSKQLSEYIHYPTLDRGESRRKSNQHTSFLNSQLLRESSRKIILEEIKESQKLIQLSVQSNPISQPANSNITNSLLNNQSQQSSYNNSQFVQQSQQLTFTQQSQNNSIYAHGPNSNGISLNNSQSNNQIQYQSQLEQINKNIQNESRQKNDSQSIKNYKRISSVTSLSQKNKQQNTFQNEKIKQKDKKEEQMQKATNQLSQISNPFNVQSLSYNQAIQLTQWSSLELNNFEKMNNFQVFFPHNNYTATIENYNFNIKKYKFLQRMDSSVIKKEKIKQLRLSIFLSKGNQKLLTQNSQKTKTKSKSQYFSKNN
ncbi:hypothetical protein ABPG74_000005 [Tetrahymena malaccensis]